MARTHGTMSCYKGGCRREECRQACREYENTRARLIAIGRPATNLVDAEPARAHAARLLDLGWRRLAIEQTAGGNIAALLYGRPSVGVAPLKRITEPISRRILAIPLELIASDKRIPADGSRRRARALCLIGHTVVWQADQAGVNRQVVSLLVNGTSGRIVASHAVALRDLHDAWWNRPAVPSREATRARNLAAQKGFLPTAAFDDDVWDLTDAELAAECARRAEQMDSAELVRCYKAAGEGDRSPLIVAGAARYLEVRRTRRKAAA